MDDVDPPGTEPAAPGRDAAATEFPGIVAGLGADELLASVLRALGAGLVVRDLRTGRGVWDARTHDIVGTGSAGASPATLDVHDPRIAGDRGRTVTYDLTRRRRRVGRGVERVRVVHPRRGVREVRLIYDVRAGADGRPQAMVGVLIDSTAQDAARRESVESLERLRTVLKLADVSVWRLDGERRRVRFDQRATGWGDIGRADDGIELEQHLALLHPDDAAAVIARAQRVRVGGPPVSMLLRQRHPSGDWRHVLARFVARARRDGSADEVLGITMDISALSQAQALNERLAGRLRAVAEAVGVGFWSRDADDAARADGAAPPPEWHWDESMFRLYGLDPAGAAPTPEAFAAAHVHVADRARWRRHVAALDASEGGDDAEPLRVRGADAAGWRWVQMRRRRSGGAGTAAQVHGLHVDVTLQHLARLALERERELSGFAMRAAGLGVWQRRLRPPAWHLDAQEVRLRGHDPVAVGSAQQVVEASTTLAERAAADAQMAQALAAGTVYRREYAVRGADGRERWLLAIGRARDGDDGEPAAALVGITVDVTARREAEALEAAKRRAEARERAKSELLAATSHELRTPLNAILGFTQLLRQDPSLDAAQRDRQLGHIADAGRRLLEQVDGLLELGQRDAASPAACSFSPTGDASSSAARGIDANAGCGAHAQGHVAPSAPASASASRAATAGVTRAPPAGPLRVLCVEDNEVNQLLLREVVAMRSGIELDVAGDAAEALARAEAFAPQVFLLDLNLPDRSGTELMAELRATPRHAAARYIALSANAMPADIRDALAAGFDDYWTKPIDVPVLLAALDALVGADG